MVVCSGVLERVSAHRDCAPGTRHRFLQNRATQLVPFQVSRNTCAIRKEFVFGRGRKKEGEQENSWNRLEIIQEDFANLYTRFQELELLSYSKELSEDGEIVSEISPLTLSFLVDRCLDSQGYDRWEKTSRQLREQIWVDFSEATQRYLSERKMFDFLNLRKGVLTTRVASFLRAFVMYLKTEKAQRDLEGYYRSESYLQDYNMWESRSPQLKMPPLQRYPVPFARQGAVEEIYAHIRELTAQLGGQMVNMEFVTGRIFRNEGFVKIFVPHESEELLETLLPTSFPEEEWKRYRSSAFRNVYYGKAGNFLVEIAYHDDIHQKKLEQLRTFLKEQPEAVPALDRALRRGMILAHDLNSLAWGVVEEFQITFLKNGSNIEDDF